MTAIAYIRQSRRADLDVALSHDAQLAAIRRMCGDCEVLEDMGRSGKAGGERLRPGYQRLIEGIASGEYTDVYAIALSRFSRSVPELHALMDLAKTHGVRIVTAKEGTMDPHTATGRMIFNTWANFAEFVRDMAVEAANENVAVRRARGDRMGRLPYGEAPGESAAAVVAAFRATGSYNGAAVRLNNQKIPTRQGKPWTGTSVRVVVARHAPGEAPRKPQRGAKASSGFRFYRLIRCPYDGRMLTGSRDGRGDRDVVYRCHAADGDRGHPRPYRIREAIVLDWIRDEYRRFAERVLPDAVETSGNEAKRAQLEDQRRAVGDALVVRAYTPVEAAAKVEAIEAEMEALDDAAAILDVPALDWEWPAADVRRVLVALAEAIELDDTFAPQRVAWRVEAS